MDFRIFAHFLIPCGALTAQYCPTHPSHPIQSCQLQLVQLCYFERTLETAYVELPAGCPTRCGAVQRKGYAGDPGQTPGMAMAYQSATPQAVGFLFCALNITLPLCVVDKVGSIRSHSSKFRSCTSEIPTVQYRVE